MESLLLGLERRLPQLEEDILTLEKENDEDLYGALSLHVIKNEMTEIMLLINKLNSTTMGNKKLSAETSEKVEPRCLLKSIMSFVFIRSMHTTSSTS